ncbi:CBS domain-containing protein [Methanocella sp. MCL-LM]|uniref:CBS domain-containing protein n=1 Tax=Methanocella sp. MCL-LM TaxID=3412035 RepID=UPI003C796AF7
MKVEEIMTTTVITCAPADAIQDVIKLMSEKNVSGIPVMDKGKLVGMVTEGDILKLLAVPQKSGTLWLPSPLEVILEIPFRELMQIRDLQNAYTDLGHKPVKDVMHKEVWTTTPETDIEDAAAEMVRRKVNRLPVVKAGQLVGIVTRDDIIHGLGGRK